jgi:hypothetical protein
MLMGLSMFALYKYTHKRYDNRTNVTKITRHSKMLRKSTMSETSSNDCHDSFPVIRDSFFNSLESRNNVPLVSLLSGGQFIRTMSVMVNNPVRCGVVPGSNIVPNDTTIDD